MNRNSSRNFIYLHTEISNFSISNRIETAMIASELSYWPYWMVIDICHNNFFNYLVYFV